MPEWSLGIEMELYAGRIAECLGTIYDSKFGNSCNPRVDFQMCHEIELTAPIPGVSRSS